MTINFLQIIGLILLVVGIAKLLFVLSAMKKGFRTNGRVVEEKKKSNNLLTTHPRISFQDQKGKKLVLNLKVSKSFIDIHAKDGQIDVIYHQGSLFHPKEIYSSLIIPVIGLILLLIGWYW
jgi:hypothetical protein